MEVRNRTHPEIHADEWDLKARKDATSFIKTLTDFPSIVGLITLYSFIHPLASVTYRTDGRSVNIAKAYEEIATVKQTCIGIHENVETIFPTIYLQATHFAAHLLVKPTMPRQKQPYKGGLRKRCSENMQQIYMTTPMPKYDFELIKKKT